MLKRVLALVFMAVLFSFNCEKGCGAAKSGEETMKEQPAADQGADQGAAAGTEEAPATQEEK